MEPNRIDQENTLALEKLVPELTRMRDSLVNLSLILNDVYFLQRTFVKNAQLELSGREEIGSVISPQPPKESE
jgi:hypothetical protein